ncbi:MAG: hypothetical protein WC353_03005 [Candidatus Peribacter sp.]|jgi:hypothetical protein
MKRRYIFIPYWKTSEPLKFGGITFRSTEDLAGLSKSARKHIETISSLFFLRDDLKILKMTYAIVEAATDNLLYEKIQAASDFQTIMTYLYSAPRTNFEDLFLKKEHGSMYIFEEDKVSWVLLWHIDRNDNVQHFDPKIVLPKQDKRGNVSGYSVLLNQQSQLWVAKGCRIYPQHRNLWLNQSQDLHRDYSQMSSSAHAGLFRLISKRKKNAEMIQRILTALRWYNEASSMYASRESALLNLAIGFESLLALPNRDRVTERFKEAIILLIGNVPRLDSWLEQFYDARSQIAHSGEVADFMFRATNAKERKKRERASRYRSLVAYGRHVFQASLVAIISGSEFAGRVGLRSMFTTNQERYQAIVKALSDKSIAAGSRLPRVADEISEISHYQFVPEEGLSADVIFSAAKLAAIDVLKTKGAVIPKTLETELKKLSVMKKDNDYSIGLSALHSIQDHMRSLPRPSNPSSESLKLFTSLIANIWHTTMPLYFRLEAKKVAVSQKRGKK